MTLWTGATSGSPGSMPSSPRIGINVLPNSANCSSDSHTSNTCRPFPTSKEQWYERPGALLLQSPDHAVVLVRAHRLRMEVVADCHLCLLVVDGGSLRSGASPARR